MSSNFLQFNPPGNNQESDPTYLADGTRTAGFVIDQIVPSPLMNKAWYQWSIFVAAFAQMMANKGFVMSDANFANLVTALTNVVTTADLKGSLTTVSYATAVTFDAALANGFYIKLTGNVSTTALTNQFDGYSPVHHPAGCHGWPDRCRGRQALASRQRRYALSRIRSR